MKAGTSLLASLSPLSLVPEYSVGFSINTIYNPQPASTNLVYWFFSAFNHLGEDIPAFETGLPITYSFRNFSFSGSTSTSLVIEWRDQLACFHVLSSSDLRSPDLIENDKTLLPLSNLDQILYEPTVTVTPPETIFGSEPEHTWCYYYEKAALAAQFEDWQQVVALGNEVLEKKYTSEIGMEWIPFIQGYVYTGDWEQASVLTEKANSYSAGMSPYLCSLWKEIETQTSSSEERDRVIQSIQEKYECAQE